MAASWADTAAAAERCACCRAELLDAAPRRLACGHGACRPCLLSVPPACRLCWRRLAAPAAAAAPAACGCGSPDPPELVVLRARRRDHLLRVLDAATALKTRLEAELAAPDCAGGAGGGSAAGAGAGARLQLAAGQARLDELVARAAAPLDAERVRRALRGEREPPPSPAAAPPEPPLLLANHCLAALYSRGCWPARLANGGAALPAPPAPPSPLPALLPRCYLDVAVDGAAWGRVVVELRADAAPRMCRNFAALCEGGGAGAGAGGGPGYRGCSVFQCWAAESVISGDWELNNGRGGRGAAAAHFPPDDSRLAATRGAVGMRREQRRRDRLGLVGSQFRVVLREMRGFTAIFASVVEGLELVDRLSRAGDSAGRPLAHITIAACGRLD